LLYFGILGPGGMLKHLDGAFHLPLPLAIGKFCFSMCMDGF